MMLRFLLRMRGATLRSPFMQWSFSYGSPWGWALGQSEGSGEHVSLERVYVSLWDSKYASVVIAVVTCHIVSRAAPCQRFPGSAANEYRATKEGRFGFVSM